MKVYSAAVCWVDEDEETLTLPNNTANTHTHINTTPATIQLKFNPYFETTTNANRKSLEWDRRKKYKNSSQMYSSSRNSKQLK